MQEVNRGFPVKYDPMGDLNGYKLQIKLIKIKEEILISYFCSNLVTREDKMKYPSHKEFTDHDTFNTSSSVEIIFTIKNGIFQVKWHVHYLILSHLHLYIFFFKSKY